MSDSSSQMATLRAELLLPIVCLGALTLGGAERLSAQTDVVELTAQQIAEGYAAGEFTAVELTRAYLDRIEAFEPNYNAFISMNPDALATAAELDQELSSNGPRGPLHGVPIVIKESMDVAGLPSTGGYAGFSSQAGGVDLIPALDAPVVARLKDAGAIILGKTNIPSFSFDGTRTNAAGWNSWDGTSYNAHDRRLAPGGSSAGTATAVAASFAVLGMGEESGGSIQFPTGAQNLVGIKPTFGLVPNVGVTPLGASTRDVLGPMAKTVHDAAVTLDVIGGYSPEDPKTLVADDHIPEAGYTSLLNTTALQGKRIGVFGAGWRDVRPSPETQTLYEAALDVLATEGATLVDDPFAGSGFRDLVEITGNEDIRGFESIVYDFEQYLDRIMAAPGGNSLESLKEATGVDIFGPDGPLHVAVTTYDVARRSLDNPDLPPDLSEFMDLRANYREVFVRVMTENNLDALVFPQMLSETPPLAGFGTVTSSTVAEINILGTPGVIVPGGYYSSGSPFSLMFHGDLFSEAELLAYAYDYEQATMHRVAPANMLNVADINRDGIVDLSDFEPFRVAFGTPSRRGDLNGDRFVIFADFVIFSKNFGYGTVAIVPEPASLTLAFLALMSVLLRRISVV